MVGVTLVEIRNHIESLASDDGDYYVVCGQTGTQPVPAAGKWFPDRSTARSAARATAQYRSTLRRYDPRAPYYDLIVCQSAGADGQTPRNSTVDDSLADVPQRDLVEFCHGVAAAVFETLSDDGHDAVETAVMEAYFDLAEALADPDDLCLCLLESMAAAIDGQLSPEQQAVVLDDAGSRFAVSDPDGNPITATFDLLQERGLVETYTQSPVSVDLTGGTRSVEVRLTGYVLSPQQGRLPVLPLVVALSRRDLDWGPSTVRAAELDDGWRLRLTLARTAEPTGLASAPID